MKKIAKYVNPISGEILYANYPAETKEIDGVPFIVLSYSKNLTRTFLYRQEAVKLDRIEDSK